jgi:hypothetical protein
VLKRLFLIRKRVDIFLPVRTEMTAAPFFFRGVAKQDPECERWVIIVTRKLGIK